MDNQRVRQRLMLLIDLGHDLLTTHDLHLLLSHALQRVLTFADHDSGCIMLYDEEQCSFEVLAALGQGAAPVGTRVANPQCNQLRCALHDHRLKAQIGCLTSHTIMLCGAEYAVASGICLPLQLSESRTIGVLSIQCAAEPRQLNDEDVDTLMLLSAQLATAIENARLHMEQDKLFAHIAASESRLRELLGRQLSVQEEERRRIAYDIHDGLAQMAASSYQHLQNVASSYRPRSPKIRFDFEQALELMRCTIKEARSLMAGLRPAALDDLGLVVALRIEVEQLRLSGRSVAFEEDISVGRLPPAVETALFRTAQEALTNIRKHAGATEVSVVLERRGKMVHLIIRDWGAGYDARAICGSHGEHMGIIGMQERALQLGGRCHVEGQPGRGTIVTVEIPVS